MVHEGFNNRIICQDVQKDGKDPVTDKLYDTSSRDAIFPECGKNGRIKMLRFFTRLQEKQLQVKTVEIYI